MRAKTLLDVTTNGTPAAPRTIGAAAPGLLMELLITVMKMTVTLIGAAAPRAPLHVRLAVQPPLD